MTTETKGIAIFLRPDVEAHTDPSRVIGRRTTCDSDEHPYLRGYEVVVIAVLKNALRVEEYDYLTHDRRGGARRRRRGPGRPPRGRPDPSQGGLVLRDERSAGYRR